jgi:hypothetical protein
MSEPAEKVEPLPLEELEAQPMSKMDVRPSQNNQFRKDPLRVYCLHQTDEGEKRSSLQANPFEVVPDGRDVGDVVYLVYEGEKELRGPQGLDLISEESGKKVYALKCTYEGRLEKSFTSRDFWKSLQSATVAKVKGANRDIEIKTYSPDEHRVSFSFPSLRSVSGGKKIRGDTEKKEGGKEEDSTNKTERKKSAWASWEGLEPPDPPVPIQYTVNGEPVESDVMESAESVLELGKRVLKMYRTVRDAVPKYGWYFEADFQLMQGVFVLAWQWREHHDHRAFLWVGAMLDLEILSLGVEIGVGVEGFGFALQLFGRINGSLGVTASLQRPSPDVEGKFEIPLDSTIKGLLGVRFDAGGFAEATGKFVTALEFSGRLAVDTEGGTSIESGIVWTGIAGIVVGSAGWGGAFGQKKTKKHVTLVDKSDLGTWEWPGGSTYKPTRVSHSKMKSIIKDNLTEGWSDDAQVETDDGERVETDILVDAIAEKIDGRGILKDEKTIEALSHNIRQRLENMEHGGIFESDALSYRQFNTFCEYELPGMLNSYVDPMAEAKKEMSGGN